MSDNRVNKVSNTSMSGKLINIMSHSKATYGASFIGSVVQFPLIPRIRVICSKNSDLLGFFRTNGPNSGLGLKFHLDKYIVNLQDLYCIHAISYASILIIIYFQQIVYFRFRVELQHVWSVRLAYRNQLNCKKIQFVQNVQLRHISFKTNVVNIRRSPASLVHFVQIFRGSGLIL